MAVWALETATNFTEFYFALEDDETFFKELAKNYFEETKAVSEKWRPLYAVRGEPKKHPDFFEIKGTDVIAISQKAVDSLREFLNSGIELLPIETDAGRYYALNVLKFVDCLNKEVSVYSATQTGIIVSYSLLEFNEEKLANHGFFKIPQLPYRIFVSDDIEIQCEEDNLRGLVFDEDSNLIWYPE